LTTFTVYGKVQEYREGRDTMLKLVNTVGKSHAEYGMRGKQKVDYVEHYTDDGVPVRVRIHDDRSYEFQSWATVERWTDDAGYKPVATLDPAYVHGQSREPENGLAALAEELADTYTATFGGKQ
jgi:hypothetical protein